MLDPSQRIKISLYGLLAVLLIALTALQAPNVINPKIPVDSEEKDSSKPRSGGPVRNSSYPVKVSSEKENKSEDKNSSSLATRPANTSTTLSETRVQTKDDSVDQIGNKENATQLVSCTWSPDSNTECQRVLSSFLCPSDKPSKVGRRVLLMGDSTMGPYYLFLYLQSLLLKEGQRRISYACPDRYRCSFEFAQRCRNNAMFGLEYPENNTWVPPDFENNYEGPIANGLENPFCTDCVSACSGESRRVFNRKPSLTLEIRFCSSI